MPWQLGLYLSPTGSLVVFCDVVVVCVFCLLLLFFFPEIFGALIVHVFCIRSNICFNLKSYTCRILKFKMFLHFYNNY